jgi:hypothetical protein
MTWVDTLANQRNSIVSDLQEDFLRQMQEKFASDIQTAAAAMLEGSKTFREHQESINALCKNMENIGIKQPREVLRRLYQNTPKMKPSIPASLDDLAIERRLNASHFDKDSHQEIKDFFSFQSTLETLYYYCLKHGAGIADNSLTIIEGENLVMNYLYSMFGKNEVMVQNRMQEFANMFAGMKLPDERELFYSRKTGEWLTTHLSYLERIFKQIGLPDVSGVDGSKETQAFLRLVVRDALEGKEPEKRGLFAVFRGQSEVNDTQQARAALEAKIGKKRCDAFEYNIREGVANPEITQGRWRR